MELKDYFVVYLFLTMFQLCLSADQETVAEECTKGEKCQQNRPFKLTVIILTMNRPHSLARYITAIFKCKL